MSPLPGWLAGAHHVALNMSNNDLPLQLHHSLFNGTGGYVLKPLEMRCGRAWPPPRTHLHRATIRILSVHNLPKHGEARPRVEGRRRTCHRYFASELSGTSTPPTNGEVSSPAVTVSLHAIGGFCAVASQLPLTQEATMAAGGKYKAQPTPSFSTGEIQGTAHPLLFYR